ncbi:MAG: hypothetical protein HC886_00565 [Leptolyngbyaceae cyanobacterium SM1_1_3]|nr:hypothetical protein [Leptolyngbyaceae cyanobacterium SM1_1_3]NJM85165.1 hypothetical protein [Leptolyngbyaceae cyanobacterium RM2_2_21]NJN02865.1 hypothetical protein [Leptolyngbyaceae cyanobacterium RM1_1_2]NJO09105.1 hypothetical protein [Leptolyngbyaceae cyanobacterium SL_1_1]
MATFTVSNLQDTGAGSLRQAILDANTLLGADSISFDPGISGLIDLSGGELLISDRLIIEGPGASLLTLDAPISNSTIANNGPKDYTDYNSRALSGSGGGIRSEGGDLTISDSIIANTLVERLTERTCGVWVVNI